jgi:hypothetical protein
MTNNQLTYWQNIERERSNREQERLTEISHQIDRERIAAQKYAAALNYKANLLAQENARYLASYDRDTKLQVERFKKYGVLGETVNSLWGTLTSNLGSTKVTNDRLSSNGLFWTGVNPETKFTNRNRITKGGSYTQFGTAY